MKLVESSEKLGQDNRKIQQTHTHTHKLHTHAYIILHTNLQTYIPCELWYRSSKQKESKQNSKACCIINTGHLYAGKTDMNLPFNTQEQNCPVSLFF